MMGLGKTHQPANFEVAIFSRDRNIKGEPPTLLLCVAAEKVVSETNHCMAEESTMAISKTQLCLPFATISVIVTISYFTHSNWTSISSLSKTFIGTHFKLFYSSHNFIVHYA